MPVESTDPTSTKPRSKWWKWVRRAGIALVILLVLLALFFRPLGHWAIRHFGGNALTGAGITGTWKTSGTLLTGLTVDELKLSGGPNSPVRSVTMDHAMVDYDLWALRGEGPGSVLRQLQVRNLNAEIDLTKSGPVTTPAPAGKKPVKLPAVRLPTVRIEHVNLRMKLKDGKPLTIEDFSLTLDPAAPGVISVSRLVAPGVPELSGVRGVTRTTTTTISFEDLTLTPDTVIEKLLVDIAKLQDAQASVALVAHQADTRVNLEGTSSGWFTELTADARLSVDHLTQESLARWGVPAGKMAWLADKLTLTAKGPVLRPDKLEMALTMANGSFVIPEAVELKNISLLATMGTGKLTIPNLSAAWGANTVTAKASAVLPDNWAAIARSKGEAAFSLNAPVLAEMLPPTANVSGKAKVDGSAAFDNMKLTLAATKVAAEDLVISGVPVESVQAEAALADQLVKLERLAVRINAQNTASASGQLALTEPKAWSTQWKIDCADLASVPAQVKPEALWPSAGRVNSSGEASGTLAAIQAKDWAALTAALSLDADGLKLREATLESLKLRATSKNGEAVLDELAVNLDSTNRIGAQATVNLTDPALPLKADLTVALPQTAKISAWSKSFNGPAIQAGEVSVRWNAEGILKPLRMDGEGSAEVKGLKLDKVPEVLGLNAAVLQSGSEVNVTTITATAGPWKAAGAMSWDGAHLTVSKLEGFAKNDLLATLTARVPLGGPEAVQGPVPPDSPLALTVKIDQLDTGKLAAALGKDLPVSAKVKLDGDFQGTLSQLRGGLKLAATDIRSKMKDGPKLDPATVKLEANLAAGKMTLNGTAAQPPLKPLTLNASLPVEVLALMKDPAALQNLPVKADVRLPESSLSFLPSFIPALQTVKGTAALDVAVSGTVAKPVWKGSAQVRVPEAEFDSVTLPSVKDVSVRVHSDGQRLTVDDASVMLAGGRLRVTGGAEFDDPKDPKLDFSASAQEVLLVRDDNLSMRANAAITCRGRLSRADVRGSVDLVRGRVFKEIEFLPLSLPNQLPPPPPSTTLGKAGPPSLPAPLDKWRFDIAINSRDPIRLLGNVARGNGVVKLRLKGDGAAPALTGTVRMEEMWLKLPFSRLNITQGVITFDEAHPFDPQIDVTGESLTGGRQVTVVVQGRALDPQVRLSSSPPLPEGEIATLLATGVTTSDLTQNSDEAAGRAAFVLLQQTYRKLFKKRAVDTADDEPPRLTFEFSLFGSDPSRRGVSAVYELSSKWRVIGKVGETGTFRGLLYYLIRFR